MSVISTTPHVPHVPAPLAQAAWEFTAELAQIDDLDRLQDFAAAEAMRLLGCDAGLCLRQHDRRSASPTGVFGLPDEFFERHRRWLREDPGRPEQIAGRALNRNMVLTPDLVTQRLAVRRHYTRDVARAFGLWRPLGAYLVTGADTQAVFGVLRTLDREPFDAAQIAVFTGMADVVSAMLARCELRDAREQTRAALGMFLSQPAVEAVALVSRAGQPLLTQPREHWLAAALQQPPLCEHLQSALDAYQLSGGPQHFPIPNRPEIAHLAAVGESDDVFVLTVQTAPRSPLTRMQSKAADCLRDGLNASQIAAELGLSVRTVRKHLASAAQRSGVSTAAQLAAGHASGLLSLEKIQVSFSLTARQAMICFALADGATTAGLSARFGISTKTLYSHLRAIYKKVGVSGRAPLIAKLIQACAS